MTAAWAGTGSDGLNLPVNEDGYIEVRTGDELVRAIRNDNSAKIRLAVDSINVGGLGQICETFSGQIVGGHMDFDPKTGERIIVPHAIYGQRGQGKGADSPLFDKLLAAHIENVAFMNFRVEVNDDSNDNLGVVATIAVNTTFKNVSTVGVSVFCNNNNAGSIVGVASNCTFDNVKAVASEVTVDGRYAGGIVGYSYFCKFNSCATNLYTHVFADGKVTDAAYAGGISGYSMGDQFYDCRNYGWVGGDEDKVGGIVGASMSSNFILCLNKGVVLQASEENFVKAINDALTQMVAYGDNWVFWGVLSGGIVMGTGAIVAIAAGFSVAWPVLAVGAVIWLGACITNIVLTQHDELGGIAGHAEDGYFEQCANEGFYNAVDKECGGIVGWGSSLTINNCYSLREAGGINNIKKTKKGETNASIIGYAKDCLITNNFAIGANRVIGKVEDMKPASGNNYYVCDSTTIKGTTYVGGGNAGLAGGGPGEYIIVDFEIESSDYEMRATTKQMMSGQLAYWLNNLHTNEAPTRWFNEEHPDKQLALRPWRQNLTGEKDSIPTYDQTHDAVRIADITTLTHITNAEGLAAYAQRVNDGDQFACAVLDNDITLSGKWTPIGHNDDHKHFRGIFDGQGHTISGLKVEMNKEEDGAGLFGAVHNNAVIRNVTVDSTSVVTNNGIGGAAGIVGLVYTKWIWSDMIIEHCGNYASVNADKHAGGILGRVMTGANNGPSVNVHINQCYNMGTITAENGNSGLLCGYTKDHAHVSNSWSGGQLRNGENKGIWPYSIENDDNHPVAECLVGFNKKFDLHNCYIVNPKDNVDQYEKFKAQYPLQAGVTIVSDEDVANGNLTLMLNGNTNDASKSYTWQQNLGTDSIPVFGNKGVYHARTVSNEYGTVCLPYALKSDEAISYYTFNESSDANGEITLNFDYAENVAPGTPVLFRVAETGDIVIRDANDGWAASPVAPASAAWNFTGTYEQCNFTGNATKTIYYVSNGAIRHSSNKVTIAPYRAYFVGPNIETLTGSNAKHVRIVIDDIDGGAMSLPLVVEDRISGQNGKSYTLYGTEAGQGYRGIMIRDGKKVMR